MDLHQTRTHYGAIVALAEAVMVLERARDSVALAHGNVIAAASVDVLLQATRGLLAESGAMFAALQTSDNPDVAEFVQLALARLQHGPPPMAAELSERDGGRG